MTTGATSQCGVCANFRSPLSLPEPERLTRGPFCAAFPDGIPDRVFGNEVDHRQPVDGDHGVRWESRNGAEFPEYAMATG